MRKASRGLPRVEAAVIGGGFYGSMLAVHLRATGRRVVLCEKHHDILMRASYANQGRIHNGYHYPRSLLTGLRSRVNFPRFIAEFPECVASKFEKVYAIAARHSQVTARHFSNFCRRIGAPLRPARPAIRRLFDPHHVEAVFSADEYAFDAEKLRRAMWVRLQASGADVRLRTDVRRLTPVDGGGLLLDCDTPDGQRVWTADQVFNCTYSQINSILVRSGVRPIPLKHELAEIALVDMPDELASVGVTVMCGPFFSCTPFPSRGLHSFSHVRYTPQMSWQDDGPTVLDGDRVLDESRSQSRFASMVRDAARYLPVIARSRHVDSLFEVKTILPASDGNDSRPILMKHDVGLPGLTCVLGAKIDNVFDMLDALPAHSWSPTRRAA